MDLGGKTFGPETDDEVPLPKQGRIDTYYILRFHASHPVCIE